MHLLIPLCACVHDRFLRCPAQYEQRHEIVFFNMPNPTLEPHLHVRACMQAFRDVLLANLVIEQIDLDANFIGARGLYGFTSLLLGASP